MGVVDQVPLVQQGRNLSGVRRSPALIAALQAIMCNSSSSMSRRSGSLPPESSVSTRPRNTPPGHVGQHRRDSCSPTPCRRRRARSSSPAWPAARDAPTRGRLGRGQVQRLGHQQGLRSPRPPPKPAGEVLVQDPLVQGVLVDHHHPFLALRHEIAIMNLQGLQGRPGGRPQPASGGEPTPAEPRAKPAAESPRPSSGKSRAPAAPLRPRGRGPGRSRRTSVQRATRSHRQRRNAARPADRQRGRRAARPHVATLPLAQSTNSCRTGPCGPVVRPGGVFVAGGRGHAGRQVGGEELRPQRGEQSGCRAGRRPGSAPPAWWDGRSRRPAPAACPALRNATGSGPSSAARGRPRPGRAEASGRGCGGG